MPEGGLNPSDVIPYMEHPGSAVRSTAAWIMAQHADWGDALALYFGKRLEIAGQLQEAQQAQMAELLSSLSSAPAIQVLLLQTLKAAESPASQRIALQAIADCGLTTVPVAWLDAIAEQLGTAKETELRSLIQVAQRLPLPKDGHGELRGQLARIGSAPVVSEDLRLAALDAAGAGLTLDDAAFALLQNTLVSEMGLEQRSIAANRLASSSLTESQVVLLLESVPATGPMELPKLLPAFEKFPSEPIGNKLVSLLMNSKGLQGLRTDLVQSLLAKYPETVRTSGKSLLKILNAGLEEQTEVLETTLATLPEGDVRRGHEVFMSRKAACNTCHKLGYGGGTLGPDLTNIGRARNRRDLLEAIIYPSASIVRGYEPVSAELDDGRVISGIIKGENADELMIATEAQKITHIARAEIQQIYPSSVSPMPNGILTLLSSQELADLLAFLQTDQR
jgi:putative heme-binding domain-containing protein